MYIRPPAVAGSFYPQNKMELRQDVENYLREARPPQLENPVSAIVVPHAGYIYSGPVAAVAYRMIQDQDQLFSRIAILGPAHRMAFTGMALSHMDVFSTPLGNIDIDTSMNQILSDLPYAEYLEQAHQLEHCLEVQLPFLQVVFKHKFQLLPILVGDAEADRVANVIETLWDTNTLIVISSDLSHFLDYQTACDRDRKTTAAIESLDLEKITYGDACGRNPLKGLLYLARKKGLSAHTLDLRNSGDTAGDKSRVVGYGAYYLQ